MLTRHNRIPVVVALLALTLSCSSDSQEVGDYGGLSGPVSDLMEVPLDQPRGPQRDFAWTIPAFLESLPPTWALAANNQDFFLWGDTVVIRRSPGPLTDPTHLVWTSPIPKAPSGEDLLTNTIHGTADGGCILLGHTTNGTALGIRGFAPDGTVRFVTELPGYVGSIRAVLPDGGFTGMFSQDVTPVPGAITDTRANPVIIVFGPDGKERTRTELLPIRVPAADHPGKIIDGKDLPGTGRPSVLSMAAAPDNGIIYAGVYTFNRLIKCGTEFDEVPSDPAPGECFGGDASDIGMVGRIDASGKIVWETRIGEAYRSFPFQYSGLAVNNDGAILATGMLAAARASNSVPLQAIATRFDASGKRQWSKSIPFGKAPGVLQPFGLTTFGHVVPADDSSFDVIFHAPSPNACRLLRIDRNGDVSRIQLLGAALATKEDDQYCEDVATGTALAYTSRNAHSATRIAN